MTTDEGDHRTTLEKATEAVRGVTETVQATSHSIAGAIDESRRPGRLLDHLVRLTRQAPLGSLAVAFLAGVVFGRRR